ncbi:MAG: hypothetical protein HY871_07980 [Chloroflexi bacterium]|nr:hypothetical protein [Chloroflexota bacterium]
MPGPMASAMISNEDLMRAVGRYMDRHKLKNVCVLQVEGGVVVQGTATVYTSEAYQDALETYTISLEELQALIAEFRRLDGMRR